MVGGVSMYRNFNIQSQFLPRDATLERDYAVVYCPSVRLSVCDIVVCFSHWLEYVENNFTAE